MAVRSRFIVSCVVALAGVAPATASAHPVEGAPSCPLFPAASQWNQRVDTLPVAAGSAQLMRATAIDHLHPDFSDSDADGYGIPYNVVDSATPRSTVSFDYDDESDHVTYPIPTSPLIEAGGDRHILLLDSSTCRLSELYAAEHSTSVGWRAGSGAVWDLRSLALRPRGWTSADAAGLPILPGLARHSDLAAGGIDHALRITLPRTQRAYLFPARHYASSERSPLLAPMGMRLRVKASYSTARFGPQTKAILEAGKRYGFIVADNGSAGYISGAPAAGWDDDDLHSLHDVPGSALEVVDTTGLTGTPRTAALLNATWSSPSAGMRTVRAFHTRLGVVEARAIVRGRAVAVRRFIAKQGLVQTKLPVIAGARYSLRVR